MHIHDTTIPIRNGIVILNGYGVRITVARRHLVVSDGIGRQRRNARFAKAVNRIRRLLIIAQTGHVTFEAIRWLRDANAVLVHLEYDGSVIAESVESLDDARLRRAQALAFHSALRVRIAHDLLAAKVQGQLAVANSFGLASAAIDPPLSDLREADSLGAVLQCEAQAAEAYWSAWAEIPVQFARRDQVPDHWRRFRERGSPLTQRPRNAINPANAMLNYLYALLEVETRIALRARGLDPGLGFFHADTANRASLAADVMEPVRPHVDAYVLNLLRGRTFSAKDFVETRDGTCRMVASLTRELAETMPTWARLVAPHAERLMRDLLAFAKNNHAENPSLTAPSRQRARIKIPKKVIVAPEAPKAQASIPISRFQNACRQCGAKLAIRKRVYCDKCLPGELQRIRCETAVPFQAAGPAKIAAMRANGSDPTNTPDAQRQRVATAKQQRQAIAAWQDDGSMRGVDFDRDILPGLQGIPVREIANAMAASISHASKVRNGRLRPHKRHWVALRCLVF